MKKTDIGVVGFMYAVCAFFFLMSRDLKKGARIYPLCIIAILFLLTTGYVVEMLFAAKKNGVTIGIPEIFEGFQPKQFLSFWECSSHIWPVCTSSASIWRPSC